MSDNQDQSNKSGTTEITADHTSSQQKQGQTAPGQDERNKPKEPNPTLTKVGDTSPDSESLKKEEEPSGTQGEDYKRNLEEPLKS
jgi:hypothetical protein